MDGHQLSNCSDCTVDTSLGGLSNGILEKTMFVEDLKTCGGEFLPVAAWKGKDVTITVSTC